MMEYKSMLHTQRAYFQTGDTKDVEFRIRQLKKLYQWITVHEQEIMDALYMDLNKSNFEAYATEIGIVKEEIRYTLNASSEMGSTEESAYTDHAISIEVFYISGTVWHRVNHVTLELSVPAYDRTTCGGNLYR